jgi:hypothetical protein
MVMLSMVLSHFFQAWTDPYRAGFSISSLLSLPPAFAGFLVGLLSILMMETIRSSETLVSLRTTVLQPRRPLS